MMHRLKRVSTITFSGVFGVNLWLIDILHRTTPVLKRMRMHQSLCDALLLRVVFHFRDTNLIASCYTLDLIITLCLEKIVNCTE